MRCNRRKFLKVLGGSVVVLGCGSAASPAVTDAGPKDSGPGPDAGTCTNVAATNEGTNQDYCGSNAGIFDLGLPSDFADQGLHMTSNGNSNVLVGRDPGGLYALSSLCTHQCCDMNQGSGYISANRVECLCHGSAFALDGTVVRGPAGTPLPAYALEVGCDGHLYVDTTNVVPNTQRLAV